MANVELKRIDDEVSQSLQRPSPTYVGIILICGILSLAGLVAFGVQWAVGMGVTGNNVPVAWALYISNYVFWIAVAMSGTFISAMLFLFRTDWRSAVNRVAETMTIFGIMVAGLFPFIHLGRNWVFWWILPYPNWYHLWPNFKSPLIWDVLAMGTYFTVSVLIFYLGLLPDIAALRDKTEHGWRKTLYTVSSLGWTGRYEQWREYTRGYLALAVVGMPIAMSVHSVVSFDFSMAMLPGWHSTFFAPYFVAGAINSGLATIITLLIPLRRVLHMERIFRMRFLEQMALLMVLMGWILGYAYGNEAFMAWYTGSPFEMQSSAYRAYGSPYYSTIFWLVVVMVVLIPMTFMVRPLRKNPTYLFVAALLVNIGMWLERYVIVIVPLSRDYLPSSWGIYAPRAPETLVTGLALGMFLGLFLVFVKLFPAVATNEIKKQVLDRTEEQP